jgi:hypothetical protein
VKGFGSALCSTTKRLIASCKSTTDTKAPRFKRRWVSVAKKPSTALSQDAEVGVKCRRALFRTAEQGIPLHLHRLDLSEDKLKPIELASNLCFQVVR